jgi:hypothetical protein
MTRTFLLAVAATLGLAAVSAPQLKTPADWTWRLDCCDHKVVDAAPKPDDFYFVAMPPGWHMTSGPGGVLFHSGFTTKNSQQFVVEADIFLFPGESQEEFGVFVGGKNLTADGTPSYLAFVARRDGRAAILRQQGPPLLAWTTTAGLAPHSGKDAVKNVVRVEAGMKEVVFSINGVEVGRTERESVNLDGHFGFRVGKAMNLHASRLDLTHRLAPTPK